jgi:hypothetical protein
MAWDNGTIAGLLAGEQYKTGRIGPCALQGLVASARHFQAAIDQPVPREITLSNLTTVQIASASAGRLYRARIENLSADIVFVVLSDNVDLQIIAALKVIARVSATVATTAEATWFEDNIVTGVAFATSLRARAFKLDGVGNVAAASGVTVKLLVG